MTNDQQEDDSRPKRLIYEMRHRVQQARNHYWKEGVYGGIRRETHLELAEVLIEYWDVLYEFREETVLEEDDFPDISEVRKRIGRKSTTYEEAPGDTKNTQATMQPAVLEIPASRLVKMSKDLDDLAKRLGFGATATKETDSNSPSMSDLRGLLVDRGQYEAVDKLPGDGDETNPEEEVAD